MSAESLPTQEQFHRTALTNVLAKLTGYGNEISSDHKAALSGLCELASLTLWGQMQQRILFALPCGMGKTTCVRAILQSCYQLGLEHRIVVASSKVEELCALKRTLIDDDGIPAESIGLVHSYPCSPMRAAAGQPGYASEPAGNTEARFLLVTHANVQSGQDKSWMGKCDLLLFDESLVVGDSQYLPLYRDSASSAPSVFSELSTLEAFAQEREPNLQPAARAARSIYDQLFDSAKNAKDSPVGIVGAGCIDASAVRAARDALPFQTDRFPLVRQLFDWAEQAAELRVFSSDLDRTTLITYAVTVPDHLQRVIVLDASGPIRELVHHDKRMEMAEDVLPSLSRFRTLPGGLASIKYHSSVQVHFACVGGGRSTLTEDLTGRGSPWVLEKLVRLVAGKPDESFLIFTHKARGEGACDFPRRIMSALVAAGIDPDEEVSSGIQGEPPVPRVAVTTWGRETGTNAFSTYHNVVLLGVMRKPEEAVAGVYLGQVDDLRCPRMKTLARRLTDSECWHSIYQAINRCRIRRVHVVDGVTQALPCNVYLWHYDSQLECKLGPVLPDCPSWLPWKELEEGTTAVDVAMQIRDRLNRLSRDGVTEISCRALRKMVGPATDSTFGRGRKMALADSAWVMHQATLTRISFENSP